ncbi:MAG: hypothetical protein LW878_08170 [Proteobacteria bacterium]|nr:hypothetical protein [Pseudomonadota bacterium]
MKNLTSFFSLIYWVCKITVIVLLYQLWVERAFAFSGAQPLVEVSEEESLKYITDTQKTALGLLGNKEFQFKRHITCSRLFTLSGEVSHYECADKTFSFIQPESTGPGGWNGYCGHVAISNATRMVCNRAINPLQTGAEDMTPGTRPDTNRNALNDLFARINSCPRGKWVTRGAISANSYINRLRSALYAGAANVSRDRGNRQRVSITPVPVLIASSIQSFHWVTLVDFIHNPADKYNCDAVMNTWGDQKIMTCENLVRYGRTPFFGFSFLSFVD